MATQSTPLPSFYLGEGVPLLRLGSEHKICLIFRLLGSSLPYPIVADRMVDSGCTQAAVEAEGVLGYC